MHTGKILYGIDHALGTTHRIAVHVNDGSPALKPQTVAPVVREVAQCVACALLTAYDAGHRPHHVSVKRCSPGWTARKRCGAPACGRAVGEHAGVDTVGTPVVRRNSELGQCSSAAVFEVTPRGEQVGLVGGLDPRDQVPNTVIDGHRRVAEREVASLGARHAG